MIVRVGSAAQSARTLTPSHVPGQVLTAPLFASTWLQTGTASVCFTSVTGDIGLDGLHTLDAAEERSLKVPVLPDITHNDADHGIGEAVKGSWYSANGLNSEQAGTAMSAAEIGLILATLATGQADTWPSRG